MSQVGLAVQLVNPRDRFVEIGLRYKIRRTDGDGDHFGVSDEAAVCLLKSRIALRQGP
jgi:hypothetical protein